MLAGLVFYGIYGRRSSTLATQPAVADGTPSCRRDDRDRFRGAGPTARPAPGAMSRAPMSRAPADVCMSDGTR